MQMENEPLLLGRESPAFKVGAKVVNPTETTALATTEKTSVSSNVGPAALAIG